MSEFNTIIHRPSTSQFVAGNLGGIFLFLLVFLLAGYDGLFPVYLFPFMLCLLLVLLLNLICRFIYLRRMQYTISGEELRYEYGILSVKLDYIELYRVVDYSEQRNFIQQIFGLKTVSIYSGDRTCPRLDIIGVPCNKDLIKIIRERVEYNKKKRNIHEFTNIQ